MYLKLIKVIVAFRLLDTLVNVECADYEFVPTDENVLSSCYKDKSHPNGILEFDEVIDISNITVEYIGDNIHIEGSARIIADLDISDRVVLLAGLFNLKRGQWVSTVFHQRRDDACKVAWSKGEIWYDSWSRHILEEDRRCPYKDAIYHFRPFDIKMKFRNFVATNFMISGLYKMVVNLEVYGVNGQKKIAMCFAVEGEIHKYQ